MLWTWWQQQQQKQEREPNASRIRSKQQYVVARKRYQLGAPETLVLGALLGSHDIYVCILNMSLSTSILKMYDLIHHHKKSADELLRSITAVVLSVSVWCYHVLPGTQHRDTTAVNDHGHDCPRDRGQTALARDHGDHDHDFNRGDHHHDSRS